MLDRNTKSLKQRLRLIFFITLLIVVSGEAGIRLWIDLPQINAMKIESDKKDFKRVSQSIQSTLTNLEVWAHDYGVWEDTFNYMMGIGNLVQYLNKNYLFGTFQAAGMSGVKLVTKDRTIQFECRISISGEQCDTSKALPVEPLQLNYIIQALDSDKNKAFADSGLFIVNNKPHLYGITKITNPRNNLTAGYLVFFQELNKTLINKWRNETQLNIVLTWSEEEHYSVLTKAVFDDVHQTDSYLSEGGYVSFSLPDIQGNNLISISFKTDSDLHHQNFISLSLILGLSAGLVIVFLYFRLIDKEVVQPLAYICKGLNKINETGNFNYTFSRFNTSEVNRIIHSFNSLMQRVEYQRKQLHDKNERLEKLTKKDFLTGLSNRRHMDDLCELLWQQSINENSTLCFCMIDCDYFKQFNDFYGHKQGDKLLTDIAGLLHDIENSASNIYAFRYGGDELALLIKSMPEHEIESILYQLKSTLKSLNYVHEKSELGRASVSIGFYQARPDKASDINDFFIKADDALYQAKKRGRNNIVNYEEINHKIDFS